MLELESDQVEFWTDVLVVIVFVLVVGDDDDDDDDDGSTDEGRDVEYWGKGT